MATEHPMKPLPELIYQWKSAYLDAKQSLSDLLAEAYQAGADHELDACINEIYKGVGLRIIDYSSNRELLCSDLRSARRPKPLSMKKQAIEALKMIATDQAPHEDIVECFKVVRSALDSLPND